MPKKPKRTKKPTQTLIDATLSITVRMDKKDYDALMQNALDEVGGPPQNRRTGEPLAESSPAHKAYVRALREAEQEQLVSDLDTNVEVSYLMGEGWMTDVLQAGLIEHQ